jgi:hypothetical protein
MYARKRGIGLEKIVFKHEVLQYVQKSVLTSVGVTSR